MPRLVRRAPLSERLKAYLDPLDWLMWISEELNSSDWEEFAQSYSLWLGFGMNLVFIIAQANAGASNSYDDDGVFREASAGWLNWFLNLLVLILGGMSFLNAGYTWTKKRHYRLFEQPIDSDLSTPSAQRVRVDSSPMTASPLRLLKNVLGASSAESRSHPDAGRDVWEIALWDPNPLCLDIFCLFSPLHVILYYLNLPVAPLDPTPSVKVTMTLFIGFVLSLQLRFLRTSFIQQIKDNAIIHREVLHEYDNKFVHPTLQRQWRDVGIQTISKKRNRDSSVGVKGSSDDLASEVTTYTPTTIIKRPFRTNPNTNYASQYDPDNLTASTARLVAQTPSMRPGYSSAQYTSTSTATGADFSSPIRPSNTPNPFRPSQSHQLRPSGSGDGGSLGVFSHAASPLRKSASANFLRDGENGNTSNSRGRDSLGGAGERRIGSPTKREGSPLKRMSMPAQDRDKPLNQAERLGRGYGGLGVGRRESGRF